MYTPPRAIAISSAMNTPPKAQANFSMRLRFTGDCPTALIRVGSLVFTCLPLQALNVLAVTIGFGLVAVDLLLLLVIGILLTLQLIAD